jgi:glycosyltransferase involved in cell wall biosynthesis
MKILVITNYLGNKGGLGRYSMEVVKELINRQISIKILSESKEKIFPYEFNLLKPIFKLNKIRLLLNLFSNILITRKISRDVDIIHAYDGWPYAVYGYFSVLGTKKKLFITGVGTYSAGSGNLFKDILLRFAYKRSRIIFCISDYVKNLIIEFCPKAKTRVVFMGTTRLPSLFKDDLEKYRKEFKLNDNYPIFLTVGDIKKRKGQLDTLEAISLLKQEYPDFKYIMIGAGDDEYYINQIMTFAKINDLSKNILLLSNIYDDKVLSFFYQISDVFCLNSNNDGDHFEGFGLVLLEAAQFGKPVVGSSGCGIESALSNGYNGYLARQKDHNDISEKILRILTYDKEVFSKNSINFYKRFSWQKTVSEYLKYYTM